MTLSSAAKSVDPSTLSRPTLCGFSPDVIPWQRNVVDLVNKYDYSLGNLEILLSGSVGSAKSVLCAHLVVVHCLTFAGAGAGVCRRSMPDLKKTLWLEILNHISEDLVEDKDYFVNKVDMTITFSNGSIIYGLSWADKKYMKFRSLSLSMLVIEEIVENNDDDQEAFKQLKARLRRRPWVPQNILIAATNPDEPNHWVYNYFILPNLKSQHLNRYVFYSRTEDNPFLDPVYVEQLRRDYSPKEVERYLNGQWISLRGETIYYEYNTQKQYLDSVIYELKKDLPVYLCFDFNIGQGKPMSSCMFQEDKDGLIHVFKESIVDGGRTLSVMEDYHGRDAFSGITKVFIAGDRNGSNKDTRGPLSDYDIIKKWLVENGIQWEFRVPGANPPLRERHNKVNAYCKNSEGKTRLFLYKGCKVTDEGMRLTKLKDASSYIEDDSKSYQHVTTALGYGIMAVHLWKKQKTQGTRLL